MRLLRAPLVVGAAASSGEPLRFPWQAKTRPSMK